VGSNRPQRHRPGREKRFVEVMFFWENEGKGGKNQEELDKAGRPDVTQGGPESNKGSPRPQ